MDELKIPIPNGLSEEHKRDLADWLTFLAQRIADELDKGQPIGEAIRLVSERYGSPLSA